MTTPTKKCGFAAQWNAIRIKSLFGPKISAKHVIPRRSRPDLSQSPRDVLRNEDRRDGKHNGKHYLFDDGHAQNGSTARRLGRKMFTAYAPCPNPLRRRVHLAAVSRLT
jgi:hypothetical protein